MLTIPNWHQGLHDNMNAAVLKSIRDNLRRRYSPKQLFDPNSEVHFETASHHKFPQHPPVPGEFSMTFFNSLTIQGF